MYLSGATKMYPYKLSESRGVVVFESFGVSERLQYGVTPDQSDVETTLLIVAAIVHVLLDLVTDTTNRREIGHH